MPDTIPNTSSLQQFQLQLTFFDDRFAFVKYEDALTLPDLADEIRNFTEASKAKLPWLKLALFGDKPSNKGSFRTNANLLAITGVEIDYDAGTMTFDEAVQRLSDARLKAIVYTSASYVAGVKEKWRVLAPLAEPRFPEHREGLVARLNGVLGGVAAPESFVLSTAFYYGSVNNNPAHRVELVDGDFLDERTDLHDGRVYATRPGKAGKSREMPNSEGPRYSDEEIEALLQKSQIPGNWHNCMVSVTSSLVLQGKTTSEIYDRVAHCCDGGWGDPDIEVMITSAREKWGKIDPDDREGLYAAIGPIVAEAATAAGVENIAEPKWRERYVETQYPKASLHNARLAIEVLRVRCSADVFHSKLFIGRGEVGGGALRPFHGEVTDVAIGGLRVCLSDTFGLDFTEKHVRDAVSTLCHENSFNPVTDMLAEAQANWDGVARLDRMAVEHFNTADTELARQMVRKTMIAAVARARQPGVKFDTILVMEAPEGWNKSTAWAVLAGEGNFSDQSILGKDGREVQEQLAGVWIHENPELEGITKGEVERIKAFASRQVDRARPAYGHFLVEQPRHSIEVGTTNGTNYLLSMTGNRRFWPIEVGSPIDLAKLRRARLQLWGEAAHYQAQGEALTLEERLWAAAGVEQEARRLHHPWEAKLAEMTVVVKVEGQDYWGNGVVHEVTTPAGVEERVSTAVIFDHVLRVPAGQMNNGHSKTLAAIMRQQGWTHGVFKLDGKAVKGYLRTKVTGSYG